MYVRYRRAFFPSHSCPLLTMLPLCRSNGPIGDDKKGGSHVHLRICAAEDKLKATIHTSRPLCRLPHLLLHPLFPRRPD